MNACVSVASVAASAALPGGEILVNLLKEIWDLCQQIKQIKNSNTMCESLYKRLEMLASRLEIERTKLEDDSAIATVIDKYLDTVKNFKSCLVDWIKYAEEHSIKKLWKLKDIPDKIAEFDKTINVLHEELDDVHIMEMAKWRQTDSKWKEQVKHKLDQFAKQLTDESNKTRDHMTEENNKTRDHVTARFESFRGDIKPKKKDIGELIKNLKKAEEKDKRSDELWDQCILALEERKNIDAIRGLLALVEFDSGDKKYLAASKLSYLAAPVRDDHNVIKSNGHLDYIIQWGGINLLMNLASKGGLIEQIEDPLGAIYLFSRDDANQVIVEIVEPLLLVLRDGTTPETRAMAAGVLYKLSSSENGMEKIDRYKGISALVNTLCDGSSTFVDQERRTFAAKALKNFSNAATYRHKVEEAIPSLRKLLPDGYDTVRRQTKQYAVWTLELLSSLSNDSRVASIGHNLVGVDTLIADYRRMSKFGNLQRAADSSYRSYR